MKRLPIGLSDYKKLIDDDFYYVDKTLFINDLLTKGGHVNLFPRPRRFGKTLNLSMIKCFFEKTETPHAYLFEDKKIWTVESAKKHFGAYPVIFLTFKSIKEECWDNAYKKMVRLIADEFRRHHYLLDSLDAHEKDIFNQLVSEQADEARYGTSLLFLSRLLNRYHQTNVIILIDEYDAPIHEAFLRGYYDKVITFMRSFLGDGLKNNNHLKLGVITGILRTAKEGIFSGLNNLEVFTILRNETADYFGFTEREIQQLLADYHLSATLDQFKTWYNGYFIVNSKIYNPWSSLNCVKNNGDLLPYWVNTSDNALIKKIIAQAQPDIKQACSELLSGKPLPNVPIEESMVLPGMLKNSNDIWNLMLFAGYLTVSSQHIEEGIRYADLIIPNKELTVLFKKIITDLFQEAVGFADVGHVEDALRRGDGKLFETLFSKFILVSMSSFDIPAEEPENSYHLFALGLLVVFTHRYSVRSNRESGYGRYDIMLIPHDKKEQGIVIEFKKKDKHETLEECTDRALEQINSKGYATELQALGITNIVLFGIGCHKKEVLLKQQPICFTSFK